MRGRRRLILGLIIAGGVLNYVDRQIIAVLKPVIEQDLHWTDSDYGRLASLFQFAAAMAFLFTGRIVDRLGVKWANPVGVGAWSLAAMAHGVARSFVQFAFVRVALGATESMATPSGIKTIAALFSAEERAAAIGISNAAGNVGAIITPLFVPLIAIAYGWRSAFVIMGLVGLVWVGCWFVTLRGVKDGTVAAPAIEGGAQLGGSILRDRRTWAIAGAKALSDQVWWLLLFWAPDFFHTVFGLGLAQLGPPLAVIYGCAALGSIIAGFASTRLVAMGLSINTVRKSALLVCALLVTPAPLALYVHNYWIAVGLISLLLAAHQGFSVNIFSLVADIVPADRVGRVTGFAALCGNLAGMTILFVAGEILTRGYGYGPLLAVAASSYLLALGWLQVLAPRLRLVSDPEAPAWR
jgi:ACS family hexuronate transporter-like MFS transporter